MARIDNLLAAATDMENATEKGSIEEARARAYRRGVIDAMEALGVEPDLISQDLRQIAMGNDRPMCGGVWLDKSREDGGGK